ncbi:MAG: hypothetical protein ACOX3U_00610 [Christensenellales bacterium]|jgi:hypothetical protein
MAKKIDFITFRVALFLLITAWMIYLVNNLALGIIAGITLFIILNIAYSYIEKKRRPYAVRDLALYLAMCDEPLNIITGLMPENVGYIREGNHLTTNGGELIYVSFGLSAFSASEALKAIKIAKNRDAGALTIVTTEADRSIFSIISRSKIRVNIIGVKQLMKLLMKKNMLPEIDKRFKLSISVKDIFNRHTGGRFLLSGSIIALMSVVMPIKLYYLIVSLICFILGLICFINPGKKEDIKSVLKN